MNPRRKIFSLDEANALLPELEGLLTQLEAKQETFRKHHDELFFAELLDKAPPPEGELQELEDTLEKLEEEMKKIHRLGCLLRHPQRGQIDFLGQKDEGWIYYCWQRGEKRIQFYHSLCGGFFERRPI